MEAASGSPRNRVVGCGQTRIGNKVKKLAKRRREGQKIQNEAKSDFSRKAGHQISFATFISRSSS